MWICLDNAFLSIVKKDCAANELLVRARREGDIERVFPDAKVEKSLNTDYLCRARVDAGVVADVIAEHVEGIDYQNFKNSVIDSALHDAYSAVWRDIARLQPGGAYSMGVRGKRS